MGARPYIICFQNLVTKPFAITVENLVHNTVYLVKYLYRYGYRVGMILFRFLLALYRAVEYQVAKRNPKVLKQSMERFITNECEAQNISREDYLFELEGYVELMYPEMTMEEYFLFAWRFDV